MAIPAKYPYMILTNRDFYSSILTLVTQQVPFEVMDIFTHYMDDFILFQFSILIHISKYFIQHNRLFMIIVLPPKQITPRSFALI